MASSERSLRLRAKSSNEGHALPVYLVIRYHRVMPTLETTSDCFATPRILFTAAEVGLDLECQLFPDGHFVAQYKVPGPRWVEDDYVLFEGNAILRYIASTHGATGLIPSDVRLRAQVDRWIDFSVLRLGMSVAGGQMDAAVRYLGVLDEALASGTWICGEFTLADCMMSTFLLVRGRLPLERFHHLALYLDRLEARPAWMTTRARIAELREVSAKTP